MSTTTIAIIALGVVVVLGLIIWAVRSEQRTRALRERFGPEYEHTVHEIGGRRRAEAELDRRQRRVEQLAIRPLPPGDRSHFADEWAHQQARFVDDPVGAVSAADRLVQEVMSRRGYPIARDFETRAADISVDHPHVVENYRNAHDIAQRVERGQAGTEDLRKAMIHYRALFEELLEQRVA